MMSVSALAKESGASGVRQHHSFVNSIVVIAGSTFQEAARRKVLWAGFLLGLAFLMLYGLGLYLLISGDPGKFSGINPLLRNQAINLPLMVALYAVNFLTVMMTVLTSIDTLAGEISSGTIQAMTTKPISRWEVLLGKWLGFVGMLTLYILLMAGGTLAVTYLLSRYVAPNMLRGLGLIWLESLLLLTVTFLWGTSFSTLTTGVLTFGLQSLAFIGGWIEQFGTITQSRAAINLGIISSIIMPSEALWRRAAFEMQSPLVSAIGLSPFSGASVPSSVMVIYAIVYLIVALGLAVRRFGQRDL
jgi:Cu-processing system permease protein